MGLLTLDEIRDQIRGALGGRVPDGDSRLTTWVNLGYMEVIGAVDFPELDLNVNINTVIGTNSYAVPAGMVQVQVVYDSVTKYAPRKVDKAEFFRQDASEVGSPKIWLRHGASVYIHPTPSDVRSLKILGRSEPAGLAADGSVTILPKTWDTAIFLLGTSYALLALNEDARSVSWYNRALVYMQSRIIEGQLQMPTAPGGQ
jgi:hypothetical protein